jgi:hypothetical protein
LIICIMSLTTLSASYDTVLTTTDVRNKIILKGVAEKNLKFDIC